jgi:hypothetical protein
MRRPVREMKNGSSGWRSSRAPSVPSQDLRGGPAQGKLPLLPPLTHDADAPLGQVDVLGVHADEFRDADQGVEEGEQNRPVPDPDPSPGIRRREQRPELIVAERLHDGLRDARHLEIRGDVLGYEPLAVSEPAQGLEDLSEASNRVSPAPLLPQGQEEVFEVGAR